ncbi:prephenate dehydratase [Anthocerotibacter panamensis]|uniref:prephenate dehydratase n=1 Tax=Anthocerotibacter panamensis TaxID=2857077 RepID=UPI001C405974|nr:prephenate dehydratase [Anthocerotibacter panamensis]
MEVCALAYLGPPGTNTEAAALAYLGGKSVPLLPHNSIQGTLRAVLEGSAARAVVPVENSIEGSVGLTLDSLWNLPGLEVQAALELPITHALMGFSPDLAPVTRVYSHPQALAQCQGWLEVNLPQAQQVPTPSTTEALSYLTRDPGYSAIAAPRAACLCDIPILAVPINDYPDNRTRFWIVGRSITGAPARNGERLSLAFSPQRRGPGVLLAALQVFAVRGINLTRIESRPSKKLMGEYVFFLDVEGDEHQPAIQQALAELLPLTERLKRFGSYRIQHVFEEAPAEH